MDLHEIEKQYCAHCDKPFSYYNNPPIIKRAENSKLWDVKGNEYIDLVAGYSSLNLGHKNKRLINAYANQANKLEQLSGQLSEEDILLSKKLVEIIPMSKKKIFITCGGSFAVESALKFAIASRNKKAFLSFEGGFHGRSFHLLPFSKDRTEQKKFIRDDSHATIVPYPYCYRCSFKSTYPECGLECVKKIEAEINNDHAGILFEPALGSGGYVFPPKTFFKELDKVAKEKDLLLIDDEIQMGLGRTGRMLCIQHYGIDPDLYIIGKSLAGGLYPLAAIVGAGDVMDSIPEGMISSTFTRNPLGCGIALEALQIIEDERLCQRSEKMGKYFLKRLKELEKDYEIIGQVEGKGLAIGIELVKKKNEPASDETKELINIALDKGLILQRGGIFKNRLCISPPLTIPKEDIDQAVDRLEDAIRQVQSKNE